MMMMMFLQPIFSNTRALPSFKKCSINASSSSLSPSRRRNRFRTWPRLKRTPGTCVCTSAWAEGVFATGRLWQTDSTTTTTTMSPHRSWCPPPRFVERNFRAVVCCGRLACVCSRCFFVRRGRLSHTHTHTHQRWSRESAYKISFLLLFEEGKNFLLFLSLSCLGFVYLGFSWKFWKNVLTFDFLRHITRAPKRRHLKTTNDTF